MARIFAIFVRSETKLHKPYTIIKIRFIHQNKLISFLLKILNLSTKYQMLIPKRDKHSIQFNIQAKARWFYSLYSEQLTEFEPDLTI